MKATITDDTGQLVGVLNADPKNFKTGSRGYFGTGKLSLNGKKYQAQLQMVEVGSKPQKPKSGH